MFAANIDILLNELVFLGHKTIDTFSQQNNNIMNKRHIIRAAKMRGWMLHPSALEGIEILLGENSDEGTLSAMFDLISAKMQSAGTVTADIWNEIVAGLDDDEGDMRQPVQHGRNPFPDLEVVSAFRTPRLLYRPTRKQFQVEESQWPLFGEAEDKVSFFYNKEGNFLLKFPDIFSYPVNLHASRRTCWNVDIIWRTNAFFVTNSFVPLIYSTIMHKQS